MKHDGIYVDIKCIEQKYSAKPCTIQGIKCKINKSKVYWLKAIIVLRNTM